MHWKLYQNYALEVNESVGSEMRPRGAQCGLLRAHHQTPTSHPEAAPQPHLAPTMKPLGSASPM